MEQMLVKTEPTGEILLFYVDENGVELNGDQVLQLEEASDFEILETADNETETPTDQNLPTLDQWSDEEVQKLLIFYTDNKEAFINGATKTQHLWAVACKTMLVGRNSEDCENMLRNLKKQYVQKRAESLKGYNITWPFYNFSHQAFYDDSYVKLLLKDLEQQSETLSKVSIPSIKNSDSKDGIIVVKSVTSGKPSTPDDKIENMLKLYLRFKKEVSAKVLWETIAMELGEESSEYWHKRFLNFKNHYLRMLAKRSVAGPSSISWPYMDLFDQIYKDDPVFQNKYVNVKENKTKTLTETPNQIKSNIVGNDEWNDAECTILAKYYFDCFHEFQDSSIPNNFLWNEVGRLLDKKPDLCKKKYEEMKEAHYEKYFPGTYNLRSRKPLDIIFDSIIAKETEIEMVEDRMLLSESWSTEELDELVKFFYQNLEMFRDSVCYFVCWACISRALKRSISSCRKQWKDLKVLYKTILRDKKDNPDMQIDWRYIELFDGIFDFGMNTNLLNDDEKLKEIQKKPENKVGAKKVNINLDSEPYENGISISDDEEFDERGFTKRNKRPFGDSKAFKILEFFQKNKDKFSTSQRKKQALWNVLGKQIGLTGEQCAHRFRNLKQVYTSYVEREITKPEMPIVWPYYALCKKVFGYRTMKTKLKNNKIDSDVVEEWSPREIKQLIAYFGVHFNELSNSDDVSHWRDLAHELRKTPSGVRDKFVELRKSYRRLKTVKDQNPQHKVTWKYYKLFDEIYERTDEQNMEVETFEDDDDYQCIIVIPEGGDINDAQIIMRDSSQNASTIEQNQDDAQTQPAQNIWTKKNKKRLLVLYHNYVKKRKGQEITPKQMWKEIASNLTSKTPVSCRKMFAKLKANHMKLKDMDEETKKKSPYYTVLEKILKLNPKFTKTDQNKLPKLKSYKDVLLPANKVELALQYYLQNVEEFASPKFEKKYLWTELANFVSEPISKLFNKINYLKQNYNVDTDEVAGEKTLFSELLREIISKENAVKAEITIPATIEENEDVTWSDDEIEQLLVWYLANLDKFKNPKFVRKYLWLEASSILAKSPLTCSKKMTEIRTQYKTMMKVNPDHLNQWRFYELCQKIYGTGKKSETANITEMFSEPAIY